MLHPSPRPSAEFNTPAPHPDLVRYALSPQGVMQILRIDDPRWTEFVGACPDATPFHNSAWTTLLSECYRYPTFALGVADADGRLAAGAPVIAVERPLGGRRWVSLPFTDHCPVLSRPGRSDGVIRLAMSLREEREARVLSAIDVHADLPALPGVHRSLHGVRHTLSLSADPGEVFDKFKSMHRRNVRRAQRSNLEIDFGRSAKDMHTFYRLHLQTRRRLGVPIQPRRFFSLLTTRLLAGGMGFVVSARLRQTPIAAAVFLHWNGALIYKYGASDPRFWELRPNNQLFWAAIQWGCEQGFRTLDWGRSDTEDVGLRAFKSGWGATEEPLTYASIGSPRSGAARGKLQSTLSSIVRRSPAWVCQVLGEVLYRYVA